MKWMWLCLGFICFAQAQEPGKKYDDKFGIALFKYDTRGLSPHEIRYDIDTLSAAQLYKRAEYAFEVMANLLVDEQNKLAKKKPAESFVLKGRRADVFCSQGAFGTVCTDAKYEIYFEFYDGGFLVRPLVMKRSGNLTETVWLKIPFDKRANFYRKDGSLKKQCLNCPEAVEDILRRVVSWAYRGMLVGPVPDHN